MTPLAGAAAVRLRYGAPGRRTFQQQIAANRGSSVLLVAVLFELMAITGFLIGAAVGVAFGAALAAGLAVAGVSILVTLGATGFAMASGDGMILDLGTAKEAGPDEQVLRNVVAELATAAGLPAPRIYVIETRAANALSVGRNPSHAAIAVTRGLLDQLDREELQGVVAHELAHVANLDSRHAVLVALLVGAIVLLTDVFLQLILGIAQNPWTGDDLGDTVAALAMWLVVVVVGLAVAGAAPAPRSARRARRAGGRQPRPRVPRRCDGRGHHPQHGGPGRGAPQAGGEPRRDARREPGNPAPVDREPGQGGLQRVVAAGSTRTRRRRTGSRACGRWRVSITSRRTPAPPERQPGKPMPRRWAGRRPRCQVFSIVVGPRRASTALRA